MVGAFAVENKTFMPNLHLTALSGYNIIRYFYLSCPPFVGNDYYIKHGNG